MQTNPLRAYLQLEARILLGFGCAGFLFYFSGLKKTQKTNKNLR